jgi:hypothetical protein
MLSLTRPLGTLYRAMRGRGLKSNSLLPPVLRVKVPKGRMRESMRCPATRAGES